MRKNKKAVGGLAILLIIIAIIGVGGGIYVFRDEISGLVKQEEFASSGCQLFDTIELSGDNANNFVCDSDECLVNARMNIEKGTTGSKVIFRSSRSFYSTLRSDYVNSWVAVDTGSGLVGYGMHTAHTSTSCRGELILTTNEGYQVYYINGDEIDICHPSFGALVYEEGEDPSDQADLSDIPKSSCDGLEVCDTPSVYKASWNLCPNTDPNYDYCDDDKLNIIEVSSAREVYTTAQQPKNRKLINGESISFSPTYSDGSPLTDKTLYIKKYDCSCLPAIDDGDACAEGQKYCEPVCNACRYNLGTPPNCQFGCAGYDYTRYLNCDGEQTIGESTCGDWDSVGHCDGGGKECIVSGTGSVGTGLGNCGCRDDQCTENERRAVGELGTQYEKCELKGECFGWSSTITCPGTLIFDETKLNSYGTYGDCVCPTGGDECTINQAGDPPVCSSNAGFIKCESYNNGGKLCYHKVEGSCVGLEQCDSDDGSCNCDGNYDDKCDDSGDIKCDRSDRYYKCSVKPGEVCFTWDDSSVSVPSGYECTNNKLIKKQGCDYNEGICEVWETCSNNVCVCKEGDFCGSNNLICYQGDCVTYGCNAVSWGIECSENVDTNSVEIEVCGSNNDCVETIDKFTSDEANFILDKTVCYNGNVYETNRYQTDSNTIYRWELLETCSGSTPICFGEVLE